MSGWFSLERFHIAWQAEADGFYSAKDVEDYEGHDNRGACSTGSSCDEAAIRAHALAPSKEALDAPLSPEDLSRDPGPPATRRSGALARRVDAFQADWQAHAKPIDWRYPRRDLNDLLDRLNRRDHLPRAA